MPVYVTYRTVSKRTATVSYRTDNDLYSGIAIRLQCHLAKYNALLSIMLSCWLREHVIGHLVLFISSHKIHCIYTLRELVTTWSPQETTLALQTLAVDTPDEDPHEPLPLTHRMQTLVSPSFSDTGCRPS